jgi:hypothetical protein
VHLKNLKRRGKPNHLYGSHDPREVGDPLAAAETEEKTQFNN